MAAVEPIAPGPRRLLKRLRTMMAARENAQERLDHLVSLIAEETGSDVCSIYLARRSGALELCATHGLKAESVHRTRLNPGEGLVGLVAHRARPFAVADAPAHPAFAYRPETGEEPFKSFVGVPILRGGRLVGVLTSQSREPRVVAEDEIETMQTVAMILAEIVASGDIIASEDLAGLDVRPTKSERFQGGAFAPGLAMGVAVIYEPHVPTARLIADDPEAEEVRLDRAIGELRESIDELLDARRLPFGGPTRDVLEAYRMFAHDRGWLERLREAVRQGLTAEAAVERVRNEHRARLMQARDHNFRERLHDLEDLANRLLRHLNGDGAARRTLPENTILFARSIGPAELLDFDRTRLRGVATEEGSASSHAAIVAKALGIPLVGRLEGALDRVEEGDQVILDGEFGVLHIRPSAEVSAAYEERREVLSRRWRDYADRRDEPAMTRDGRQVELHLNAGLLIELTRLQETGANGIGLFRTEFQFMVADTLPSLVEQTRFYSTVLDSAGAKPVVFRTLDLGGDKVVAYAPSQREANPALGWRALRMGLDRPGLLRYQLRALVLAAAGRRLNVLFPMISAPWELIAARGMLDRELERARRMGVTSPESVRVGMMLETPGLAWAMEHALPHADFVSVGANDLMQYFFAADRQNPRVADRYDVLSPPALGLLKSIADTCRSHGVPVSICGEVAGRPLEAAVLVALGYETLSMAAGAVGPVKKAITGVHAGQLGAWLAQNMARPDASLRPLLINQAESAGVRLETVDNHRLI